jgi:hypothetical protein
MPHPHGGSGGIMSLDAWGDEGDVPSNGQDTMIWQELIKIRDKYHAWTVEFKHEYAGPEMQQKASETMDAIDELLELIEDAP